MSRFRSSSLVCLIAFAVSMAFAQTGAIQGTLTDAAGATVPNAKVTAIDQDKAIVAREGTSSNGGDFHLTPLLPGHYTVRVEAHGFKTFESKNLTLDQNQIMNLDVLSSRNEEIAVTSACPFCPSRRSNSR